MVFTLLNLFYKFIIVMFFVQSRANKASQNTLDGDWADVVPAKSVGGSMRQLGGSMRHGSIEHR
jgi:hypothetical protein